MNSADDRMHEPVTIFDVIIITGVVTFMSATVWWAYQASVMWGALQ